jgi:ATP-dependent DNA ligase
MPRAHIEPVPASLKFIPPCLPILRPEPPIGADWIHEIKHDGWRLQVHKSQDLVRLFSKNGSDYLGLEGIVSKRRGSPYRSGPRSDWIKVKTATWRLANRERYRLFRDK